ncbi:MAG: pyridoxal phosphate-dependent aminotransferase [Nanoarchaeota archaeon]
MFARRMEVLGTETAFEVLAKARALEAQGKHIVHLEIGEPDFNTPENIKEAAIQAIKDNFSHYTPSAGIPELRAAVASSFNASRGTCMAPENVVITPGAKPIIFFGILACVNPGDEVIFPNPGYPIYESMINFVGGKAVGLPLLEEHDFRFSVDTLKKLITKKTRMIVINSPQNPTGGMLEKEDLEEIAALAVKHDLWVMSDEAYSAIYYEGKHHSIMAEPGMDERTIMLDGFSKTYAMTGWRLGYGVMPKALAVHMTRLMTNSNSHTATFIQKAGVVGLEGSQDSVRKMVAEFKKRRDIIIDGLNKIPGMSCRLPKGAFYAFPNVKKLPMQSPELADYLLNEGGVACLSGTCFGSQGAGYLRFSYANSVENIREGLKRVKEAVGKL